jgi:hypothetical protein
MNDISMMSGWSKLYHDAVGVLPDKLKNKNTQTVYINGCFIATNSKYTSMKYSNGEWKDIEAADIISEQEVKDRLNCIPVIRDKG